jgi:predicted nuclease with TOPRIM domain
MTPSEKKTFKRLISFVEYTQININNINEFKKLVIKEINILEERVQRIEKQRFDLESDFDRLQDQIDVSQLLKDVDK